MIFKTLISPVEVASPYMYDREAGRAPDAGAFRHRWRTLQRRRRADDGRFRKGTEACAAEYFECHHQNARDILGKPPKEQGKTADEMLV